LVSSFYFSYFSKNNLLNFPAGFTAFDCSNRLYASLRWIINSSWVNASPWFLPNALFKTLVEALEALPEGIRGDSALINLRGFSGLICNVVNDIPELKEYFLATNWKSALYDFLECNQRLKSFYTNLYFSTALITYPFYLPPFFKFFICDDTVGENPNT
jgi:hypothetical protein